MTKTIPLFSLAFACIPAYLAAETFTLATFNIRCPRRSNAAHLAGTGKPLY